MIRNFFLYLTIFILSANISFAETDKNDICTQHFCKIIIDAGSSGTRVHLYAYDKNENNIPVNIDEIYVNKVTPGLSSIQDDKINSYFSNIMQQIPEKNIDVFIYATAGMRLLSEEKQNDIYSKIKQWFDENEKWHLADARTITGSEEGVFGWLATNYSLDLLNGDAQQLPGFIEIGGASTQIVFPIVNYTNINSEDISSISIYGKRISLFSHSFLGLGINEVFKKFINNNNCFPIGYILPNQLAASGDARQCGLEIFESINESDSISNTVLQASTNNKPSTWYTVGAASITSKKPPLSLIEQFTAQTLLDKADLTYCKQDWDNQKINYSDDLYLDQNCIVSSLFYSLSVYGYGISPDQTINNISDDKNSDWTLGALILGINIEHHTT